MKYFISLCAFLLFVLSACNKPQGQLSIAILTPVTHPSLQQAEEGFIQTLEAQSPGTYRFVTYNAQGNKTLMRSELETIAREDYALVFTIGTSASQMATEVFSKKELKIPIIFTCVNDPMGFQIVQSEEAPGGTVTGVKEMLNFKDELAALLRFKPDLKQVLLVYNPAEPGLAKDQQEIQQLLETNGIRLVAVEVFQTNEIKAKAAPFMEDAEALIVLKDNTVVSGLETLVKLCNQARIPLMASDLDSPDRGAALGYGVHEKEFGIEAAKKAALVLEKGISPAEIPVTPVSAFSLRINLEAAQRQGIDL